MILTREFSLAGLKTLLCFTVRDNFTKSLLCVQDPGTVTITDSCGTEVAQLTPSILRTGRLFAEWDIPLDQKPGVYTEQWSNIVLRDGRTLSKTNKIFISDEPYNFDDIPSVDFDISINKITLHKPTIEPVLFTLNKPEYIIFPKTEARIFRRSTISVPMKVTVLESGPGIREPFGFNSFDEPVLVVDKEVDSTTEFFPLTSWENKAYFLLDTTDLTPTTYRIQLRIYIGEFEYVERNFSFVLKDI